MHELASFQAYKAETFQLLNLTAGSKVADVGCGTGDDVRKLASLVGPRGLAVGYDASEAMLQEAAARHGALEGVRFERADIEALGAADGAFDAVRADRVLIHVRDPATALREMLRVLRPGGRIIVCEPDMPGCWVAARDSEMSELLMARIAGSCAHPYIARNLYAQFRELGLQDVQLAIKTVTAFTPDSIEQTLRVTQVLGAMVQGGAVSQERAADWAADVAERGRTGRFVAGLSVMVASGTKA